MDGVEIVMQVEDAFAIVIDDSDAEKIKTPRALIDHIMGKIGRGDQIHCATQRAFHQLRVALMRHCGLVRTKIRPKAEMSRLLPFRRRKVILRQILDEIGVLAKPQLIRPKWLVALLLAFSLLLAGVAASRVLNQSAQGSTTEFGAFVMTFGVVAILCGAIAAYATRELRSHFKPPYATAGGFSRWMVVTCPEIFGGPTGESTRDQIAEKVRAICIDVLACEKVYSEDADFVKDLGLS